MSAFSISKTQTVIGNLRLVYGTITGGSNDYVNGAGYALTAASLGLKSLFFLATNSDANGFDASITLASNTATMKVFDPTNTTPALGPGVEIQSAVDISGSVWPFFALGV